MEPDEARRSTSGAHTLTGARSHPPQRRILFPNPPARHDSRLVPGWGRRRVHDRRLEHATSADDLAPMRREFFKPYNRIAVDEAHWRGLEVVFHTCDNVAAIVDDLIDDQHLLTPHLPVTTPSRNRPLISRETAERLLAGAKHRLGISARQSVCGGASPCTNAVRCYLHAGDAPPVWHLLDMIRGAVHRPYT